MSILEGSYNRYLFQWPQGKIGPAPLTALTCATHRTDLHQTLSIDKKQGWDSAKQRGVLSLPHILLYKKG